MKAPERIYIDGTKRNIQSNVFTAYNFDHMGHIEYIRNDLAEKQTNDALGQLLNPLIKLLSDSDYRRYVTEFINSRKAEKE